VTIVLAGTERGIHRLGNGAPSEALVDEDVRSIVGDGSGWLAVGPRTVWHSADGGRWSEWTNLEAPSGTCVSSGPAGRFVGLTEARLAMLEDGGVAPVGAFDGVEGRSDWHTPWGGPPDVRSIAQDAEGVYVNVHVGGIPVSRDHGRTWVPTIDIDADVHQVVAGPEPGTVLAACARGLAVSADGGRSWALRTEGLHATYARAVTVAEDRVLLSASTGPRGNRAAVYRQPLDGSGPFERCAGGLPEWFGSNVDTFCLVASGRSVVLGTDEGLVYRSEDHGSTWERVAADLPPVRCLALG
jgi:hypothetical protein